MFNYGMIDDVYDKMYEEAVIKERRYMDRVKEILKRKDPPSPTDQALLNTNDPEQFFNLLLNGYNGTRASATVNALAGTYTVNIGGQTTTYTVKGTDKKKIDDFINNGKLNEAAGYLFELAAGPILDNLLTNLGTNIKDKYSETKFIHHIDTYTHDYQVYYDYTTKDSLDMKGGYLFPLEVKAKIDDFHVANARNNGILNILDYKQYLDQDTQKRGYQGYDVYEYIKMKLVVEKLKNSYPIFHSVNNSNLGTILSSTMLSKSYNFYLKNDTMPSDSQIFAMAKKIVEDDSNEVQADLFVFNPSGVDKTLSVVRQNDSAMREFTQTILDRVVENAAANSGIRGFSLWYGKRF